MKNSWFVNHSRRHFASQRLFAFPYAGGNAHIFRPWADALPVSVEVIGIEAPGKGSRLLESPYTTVNELINGLLVAMEPLLYEKPFSFFGHSNGAMIAFELSSVLQRRGLPMPQHLFLSASPAPWTRVFDQPYSAMNNEEFKTVLRDLQGTPAEVLDDAELFELVLPGLRADFCLAEGYAYSRSTKLPVPTSIFYGEHDEIEETHIYAWQDQIASDARFKRVPGGHFFIHSHLEYLTETIGMQLAEVECNPAYSVASTEAIASL